MYYNFPVYKLPFQDLDEPDYLPGDKCSIYK